MVETESNAPDMETYSTVPCFVLEVEGIVARWIDGVADQQARPALSSYRAE